MVDKREERQAWDAIAYYWHERMGEGNDFVDVLIWPVVRRLLPRLSGLRVLDVGCGNGLYARKLAAEGARVLAIDFSARMIEHATTSTDQGQIEYRVLDATDQDELDKLPTEGFDAALCTMVLMDMAEIQPLMQSLPRILVPGGSFVFATAHPCFNSPHAHLQDGTSGSTAVPSSSIRVDAYQTPSRSHDMAMRGQPAATLFFHRSISALLRPAFAAGLVLDALEESSFSTDHESGGPNSWGGRLAEFPAVLAGRMRRLPVGA